MNSVKVLTLEGYSVPERLRAIPDAPSKLYLKGTGDISDILNRPIVAIVGSRKVDAYGEYATKMLARGLAEKGVVIISGLALGTDAIAHQACLSAGTPTLAVLVSDVSNPVPKTNYSVAQSIYANGFIISENDSTHTIQKHDFLTRNRLISGLAMGVIIPQASARSGSLNTARHALEQGRTVMTVPGPITNPLCEGPNNLLKMGATPVTNVDDVLHALNIADVPSTRNYDLLAENQAELDIIKTIQDGVVDADEILALTKMRPAELNVHLTMLEIRGIITPLGGNHWTLK